MAKSMIIYGVPGGKTRFAQRIADHFGLTLATYRNGGAVWANEGFLYFIKSSTAHPLTQEYSRSFQSVADEINATISLTDWQSGPPPMVGEWIASVEKDRYVRRWWDGNRWSIWYSKSMPQERRDYRSSQPCIAQEQATVQWRGLSSEPIKVTE